jgi:hypothetical protein
MLVNEGVQRARNAVIVDKRKKSCFAAIYILVGSVRHRTDANTEDDFYSIF